MEQGKSGASVYHEKNVVPPSLIRARRVIQPAVWLAILCMFTMLSVHSKDYHRNKKGTLEHESNPMNWEMSVGAQETS